MTGAASPGAPAISPGLGLVLPTGPGPSAGWPHAGSWFAGLESSGCSAIWFTDHLFFGRDTPDALSMAAVAAASTTRCTIGTGVLQLPLRQVAAVAKSAATVSALAPGRFVLGVGVGEHRDEYELAGADFTGRGAALDSAIDRVRELWSPADDWFAQRPTPKGLPIWIGGRSDRALDRAAHRGDGWFPMFVSPDGFARRDRELTRRLDEQGRPGRDVSRAVLVIVSVDRPAWRATDARSWAASLFRASAPSLDRQVVTGTSQACARRLVEYRDAGAEHIAVLPAGDDPRHTFASLGDALAASRHERAGR